MYKEDGQRNTRIMTLADLEKELTKLTTWWEIYEKTCTFKSKLKTVWYYTEELIPRTLKETFRTGINL